MKKKNGGQQRVGKGDSGAKQKIKKGRELRQNAKTRQSGAASNDKPRVARVLYSTALSLRTV